MLNNSAEKVPLIVAVASYNDNDYKVYFSAETKGDNYDINGRPQETQKTDCGKMHFINALGVTYKIANSKADF